MADLTIEIKGLSELKRALEQLPKELAGKILAKSVKDAADLVRDQARQFVARGKLQVQRSTVSYRDRQSTDARAIYNVGVTMKKKWPRRYRVRGSIRIAGVKVLKNPFRKISDVQHPAYWWRFLEFGTRKMSAKSFLRPAFEMQQAPAALKIRDGLAAGLEQAVAKLRWK